MPLLEVDGHKISQSGAIVRFLAKRFNLNGKDEFEAARADEIFNFFYDNIRAQVPYTLVLLGIGAGDKVFLIL
jgi:glutathione S-transferase